VVYLDDRHVGIGPITVTGLHPGRYRVFLRRGRQPGRVHEVEVRSGATSILTVSWATDAALRTAGDRARLVFADADARRRQGRVAVDLATALDAPVIALVGVRHRGGRRWIT